MHTRNHQLSNPGSRSFIQWGRFVALLAVTNGAPAATHYVDLNSSHPTPPYTTWATAATVIQDAIDAATAGDEVVVTNGVYATSGNSTNRVAVNLPLTVRSVNGPEATLVDGRGARCVRLATGAVLAGFTLTNGSSWRGAGIWCESLNVVVSNCVLVGNSAYVSETLAVDAGFGGGAYQGTLEACALIGNSAVDGGGAYGSTLVRCSLLSNHVNEAVLDYGDGSFQPYGGYGGGVYRSTLTACIISSNSAIAGGGAYGGNLNRCTLIGNSTMPSYYGVDYWGQGGGVLESSLNNCVLYANSAFNDGGGACLAGLTNCTVCANVADSVGGALACTLVNCILQFNDSAFPDEPNYSGGTLNFCCTTPMPDSGVGNITNPPLFMDQAGGNLRLQFNSPCINAGNNTYPLLGPDLEGNPRISGGTVDIGAYELQNPSSRISIAWLQQHGLPTDGSADDADPDGDGMSNWQEWRCQTDPTNPLSALRLLSPVLTGTNNTVTWQSALGVSYFLERSTNLATPQSFAVVATNIIGHSGATSYTDTNAVGASPLFYRVGVGN